MDEEKDKAGTADDEASSSEESQDTETDETGSKADEENVETKLDDDSDADEDIYETELEKERKRLGAKIDKERQKRIEAEKAKGLSREETEKLVDERVAQTEKRLVRTRAEQIASEMAGSDSERELILHCYDHLIIPTGNLDEDMANAHAIANKKKLAGTISELRKAAQSRKNVRTGNSDAGASGEQPKKPKQFSQEIIEGAEFAGTTPEKFAESLDKNK